MSVENMLKLLTPEVRKLPRFSALAEAVLRQIVDLQAVIPEMEAAYSLDSAAGMQLDLLGESFGLSRGKTGGSPVPDEEYREMIRAKLALWRWDGTNETVSVALAESFPGKNIAISDNGDCTVTVTGTGSIAAPAEMLPVPAGVKLQEA